jgi:hypothetical protein
MEEFDASSPSSVSPASLNNIMLPCRSSSTISHDPLLNYPNGILVKLVLLGLPTQPSSQKRIG